MALLIQFNVVIDDANTPHADVNGISYKLYSGTQTFNEVEVYSGDNGAIVDGVMSIFTPDHVVDDQLILSANISNTTILSDNTEHLRATGFVIDDGNEPPLTSKCLVTTGNAGLNEYGTFNPSFALTADWKVKFTFDFDSNLTNAQGYIATGPVLKLTLKPSNNQIQMYDGSFYYFTPTTLFGTGTGEHTIELYQDGSNVSIRLDGEVVSTPGVISAPVFEYILTNAALADKFVGKVIDMQFYNGSTLVHSYDFSSGSTITEPDNIGASNILYNNVTEASWQLCDGSGTEPPVVEPPPTDTFLEYKNVQTARWDDTATVIDPWKDIGYPRIITCEGPATREMADAEPNYECIKKYDAIHSHAYTQDVIAGMQANWTQTKHLRQINIEYLDFNEAPDNGSSLYQARNPSFVKTGSTSSATDGTMFAGHWLYLAASTITASMNNSQMSITVASNANIQVGGYVVICDQNWNNSEHFRVSNVVGTTVSFDKRGYRSAQVTHGSGSRIAKHVAFNPTHQADFMYNMTTKCPVDGAGRKCNEWFALWASQNNTLNHLGQVQSGLRTDGVAWDIDFKDKTHNADFDNSGNNDTNPNDASSNWLWQGLDEFYAHARAYMPTLTNTAGLSRSPGYGGCHGTQEEGWPVDIRSTHNKVEDADYDAVFDKIMNNYILRIREGRLPVTDWHCLNKNVSKIYGDAQGNNGVTIFDTDCAAHRVALATCLMGPAMYTQQSGPTIGWNTGRSYDPWYDEFSINITTGVCWKAGEWYRRAGATSESPDSFADVISGKGWLGQPVEDLVRVFNDTDFDQDDVIYEHLFKTSYANWTGSNIPLSLDAETLKCGPHTSYQATQGGATLNGPSINLVSGQRYTFVFKARADRYREIIFKIGNTVLRRFDISDEMRNYSFSFKSTSTLMTMLIELGMDSTNVWFSTFRIFPGEINAFQREFEHGMVLANVNFTEKTFGLPANTYKRILGYQAPEVNTGADVGSTITIPALDAILLVKK